MYLYGMARNTGITAKFDIDEICDMISEGEMFTTIAKKYGCAVSLLYKYLCRDEHSARFRNALDSSASAYANKGEKVLIEAPADKIEIMRARELAQHYRWMAGKRSPGKYGDKVDVTSGGEKIEQSFVIAGQVIKF